MLDIKNRRLYSIQSGMLEAPPERRELMKQQGEQIDKEIQVASEELSQAQAKADKAMQYKLDAEKREAEMARQAMEKEEAEALAAEQAFKA